MVQKSSDGNASMDCLFLCQSEHSNMFRNNCVFFEINAFINASLDYSFLNATSVLYSKHSANIFSLAKNPLKLYTH